MPLPCPFCERVLPHPSSESGGLVVCPACGEESLIPEDLLAAAPPPQVQRIRKRGSAAGKIQFRDRAEKIGRARGWLAWAAGGVWCWTLLWTLVLGPAMLSSAEELAHGLEADDFIEFSEGKPLRQEIDYSGPPRGEITLVPVPEYLAGVKRVHLWISVALWFTALSLSALYRWSRGRPGTALTLAFCITSLLALLEFVFLDGYLGAHLILSVLLALGARAGWAEERRMRARDRSAPAADSF